MLSLIQFSNVDSSFLCLTAMVSYSRESLEDGARRRASQRLLALPTFPATFPTPQEFLSLSKS